MDRQLNAGEYLAFNRLSAEDVAKADPAYLRHLLGEIRAHYSLATVGQVPELVLIAVPQETSAYVRDQIKQLFNIQ